MFSSLRTIPFFSRQVLREKNTLLCCIVFVLDNQHCCQLLGSIPARNPCACLAYQDAVLYNYYTISVCCQLLHRSLCKGLFRAAHDSSAYNVFGIDLNQHDIFYSYSLPSCKQGYIQGDTSPAYHKRLPSACHNLSMILCASLSITI